MSAAFIDMNSADQVSGDDWSPEKREHMAKVQTRYQELENGRGEEIQSRLAGVKSLLDGQQRKTLLETAVRSKTAAQRVHWLRREADLVNEAIAQADAAACRKGCNHCCHTGVLLSEGEARVIGKAIGRQVQAPAPEARITLVGAMSAPEALAGAIEKSKTMAGRRFNEPCTFLTPSSGECSIYNERPMACRILINVDADDLLCELVEGETIRVPYVNMQSSQVAYIFAWGENSVLADIRDWFTPNSAEVD